MVYVLAFIFSVNLWIVGFKCGSLSGYNKGLKDAKKIFNDALNESDKGGNNNE